MNNNFGMSSSFVSSLNGLVFGSLTGASTSAPPPASKRDLLQAFHELQSAGDAARHAI